VWVCVEEKASSAVAVRREMDGGCGGGGSVVYKGIEKYRLAM